MTRSILAIPAVPVTVSPTAVVDVTTKFQRGLADDACEESNGLFEQNNVSHAYYLFKYYLLYI